MTSHASGTSAARWMLTLIAAVLMLASSGFAQDQSKTNDELLDDFVHYVLIAKPDLAEDNGRALLDSGITSVELANIIDEGLVEQERFDRALDLAYRIPELEDIAGELAIRVEAGRLEQAREARRISEAIQMLVEHQRAKMIAEDRLMAAGEYAVPALLRTVEETNDERLRLACTRVLVKLERLAVTPLTVALPYIGDPAIQRSMIDVLAEIGHSRAAPALRELAADESAPDVVRGSAMNAFRRVGGVDASLSDLHATLGMRYFMNEMALVAYPSDETNNVWAYDAHAGLIFTAVPTPIFGQVMAMKHAQRALQLNGDNGAALSLFVAANLKRENNLPGGASDPVYGGMAYSPSFYATVFGSQVCQDVLGMALDTVDTPLVRDAIAALAETTGGSNLFAGGGRQPLLEALRYPDRRVQYDAALTLGRALPTAAFNGDFAVVPLLASAVRTSGETFAGVLAATDEDRRELRGALEAQNFTVIGAEPTVDLLAEPIGRATAIDLIVAQAGSAEEARDILTALRNGARTAATPVVVLVAPADEPRLELQYRGDRGVRIATLTSNQQLATVVENAMQRAVGGRMSEAESEQYAFDALGVLRDIAISRNRVYDIADAEASLLESLGARSGGARGLVAQILALIDSADSQRALFETALAAPDFEQIELLNHTAASIRRYGSSVEPRHVAALLALINNSSGETAEAAARVHGALNSQPTPEAIDLVTGTGDD